MRKKGMMALIMVIVLSSVLALFGIASAQDNPGQAFLGIRFAEDESGAKVTRVLPGSPADAAGLEVGDVITAMDGTAVTVDNLSEVVQSHQAGDTVTINILRDGEAMELAAELGDTVSAEVFRFAGPDRAYIGIAVQRGDEGATITQVAADSPAAAAGLQVDDVVTAINGTSVNSANDIRQVLRGLNPDDVASLDVLRGGEAQTVEVTLGSLPAEDFAVPFGRGGFRGGISITIEDGRMTLDQLSEDHPLYEAGLREGDVVTAINGQSIDALEAGGLADLLAAETITLTVERGGESLDIEIPAELALVLGGFGMRFGAEIPFFDFEGGPGAFGFGGFQGRGVLGVRYVTLSADNAAEYDVAVTDGAYIAEVIEGSPAAEAGFQVGDVITAVNGEALNAEITLRDRLSAYEPGDTLSFTVLRGGETLEIEVRLPDALEDAFVPGGAFGFGGRGGDGPFGFGGRDGQGGFFGFGGRGGDGPFGFGGDGPFRFEFRGDGPFHFDIPEPDASDGDTGIIYPQL